ncbi:MFS monosaccharide transporter [Gautieria morchelliformis]|nr:MFS monosaccharide transporter [Gautieria morchelliformis]
MMSRHYTQLPSDDADSSWAAQTKYLPGGGSLVIDTTGKYTYAYGPPGLKGLFQNSFALRCSLFASLGGLTFGYDQGVIANVLVMKDFVARWPIGPWEKGLMTAVLELGALIGALTAGIMADRLSRRGSICFACVIFCIGSAFQCFASSISTLTIGRAIGGFGIGALSMLSPLYIGEIGAPESRGALLALEQLGIVFGVVIGFWFGFLTRSLPGSSSWRLPLGIQILPGVLLGAGCFFLPPSPRFLVHQGKNAEALHALARLRFPRATEINVEDPLLRLEFLEMQVDAALALPSGKGTLVSEVFSWGQLFDHKYRRRTLVGIAIMFWQQWSGINALLYYGPSLIESIGFTGDSVVLIGSGFINITQFLAVIPTILYIDRIGRKPLLFGGAVVMGSSHTLISLLVWTSSGNWASHRISAWVSLSCMYLFTASYGVSYGPIAWVLTSEVFPLSVRSRGVAISTASNWLNNFLIGLVTPAMLEISAAGTYFVFAFACFAACIWSILAVPETAGVSLEEIDKIFNSSAGRDEEERRASIERRLGLHHLLRHLAEGEDEE